MQLLTFNKIISNNGDEIAEDIQRLVIVIFSAQTLLRKMRS